MLKLLGDVVVTPVVVVAELVEVVEVSELVEVVELVVVSEVVEVSEIVVSDAPVAPEAPVAPDEPSKFVQYSQMPLLQTNNTLRFVHVQVLPLMHFEGSGGHVPNDRRDAELL